jgi:hypothetical protein
MYRLKRTCLGGRGTGEGSECRKQMFAADEFAHPMDPEVGYPHAHQWEIFKFDSGHSDSRRMKARSVILPPGCENEDEEGRGIKVYDPTPAPNPRIEAPSLVLRVYFTPHFAGDNDPRPIQSRGTTTAVSIQQPSQRRMSTSPPSSYLLIRTPELTMDLWLKQCVFRTHDQLGKSPTTVR